MATVNDAKFAALRTLAYTGSINDMTLQWLQANGATADAIPDAWREFLDANLVATPTGQRNDDWYQYLVEQGHSGSLNDMELAFWDTPAPSFGPELITNGEFVDASDWTVQTGWIIQGGRAECNNIAALDLIQTLPVPLVSGKTYQLNFDMLNYVLGEITVRLTGDGSLDFLPPMASDGHYTDQVVAVGNYTGFRLKPTSNPTTLMVDNVSLKEVL